MAVIAEGEGEGWVRSRRNGDEREARGSNVDEDWGTRPGEENCNVITEETELEEGEGDELEEGRSVVEV